MSAPGAALRVEVPERLPGSVAAALRVGKRAHRVRIEAGGELSPHADAFVAAALAPAMQLGIPMESVGPVTPRLLDRLPRVQRMLHNWWPHLREIPIRAPVREPMTRAPGVAAFFSGGVDSLHTAVTHREELDALVFIAGFDLPLGEPDRLELVAEGVRRMAVTLGVPLVEMRTDVRYFQHPYASWVQAHAGHLFGAGYALAPRFGRMLVASSSTYFVWTLWGSHPILDPAWSTEEVEFVHDAYLVSRAEKIGVLAQHPDLLPWLRVCHQRGATGYNCGRCEKCVRTMVTLAAAGALDRGPPFERELDLDVVRTLHVSPASGAYWEDVRRRAIEWGAPGPLLDAVVACQRMYRRRTRTAARAVRDLRRRAGTRYRRLRGRLPADPWAVGR
jgi:hypothetical protein